MNNTSKNILGKIIWLRNKSEQGYVKARKEDSTHHAHLKDAWKAFCIGMMQLGNMLLVLAGIVACIALFVSPFETWITMQDALRHNLGIMMHILVAFAAGVTAAIGIGRYRRIGSFGHVAVFLAGEYFKVDRWMINGHTRTKCLEYFQGLTFSDDVELYCKWQRHLYESLVSFAGEIYKDEKKFNGSSRGFLEPAFVNQLKIGEYFGLGNLPALRKEVFSVAQGTRAPRYLDGDD